MKKFLRMLAASFVGVGMFTGVASAAVAADPCPTGTIQNTGAGSNNSIVCETTVDTRVTCVNGIYVVGQNGQQATTGGASGSGNTSGGVVVTGDARNDNDVTVTVGASCAAAPVTPTTPTTPTTPSTSAPTVSPAATTSTPAQQTVASLPKTGTNNTAQTVLMTGLVLGAGIAATQFGMVAYRRLFVK